MQNAHKHRQSETETYEMYRKQWCIRIYTQSFVMYFQMGRQIKCQFDSHE